jgi:hypothetical protein
MVFAGMSDWSGERTITYTNRPDHLNSKSDVFCVRRPKTLLAPSLPSLQNLQAFPSPTSTVFPLILP